MRGFLKTLMASTLLSGCVHMSSISTTSIPVDRSTEVYAESERLMFFYLNFDNSYVDYMVEDLAAQCPDGRVEGILTKQEFVVYIPLFFNEVRVSASGFCVARPVPVQPTNRLPLPPPPEASPTIPSIPEAMTAPAPAPDAPAESEDSTP